MLPEPIQVEWEDYFEVEALLKHINRNNSWQYLVKWLRNGSEHDKWVHEVELADGAEVILRQYQNSHGLH